MARVSVDFSQVEEFEPLPKGEYTVLVEQVEYREAQSEDKFDYLNWELSVSEEGEFKGRKLWFISSFSPKALWRLKQILENLGVYEDDLEIDYDEDTMMVTDPELTGLPALATVSTRPYEGRVQNNVDALTAIDAGPAKKTAPGAKKTTAKPAAKKATGAKRTFK